LGAAAPAAVGGSVVMLALAGAGNGGKAAGLMAVAPGFNAVVVCVAIGGLIIRGSEAAVLAAATAGWVPWP